MAASSEPPPEPDPGALVDPEELERRRAAREDPSAQAEVERLRAQQALAERRTAELEAEVVLLSGELDRRAAEQAAVASQVARLRTALAALRRRAVTEEAEQAGTAGLLAQLRAGQERVAEALEELQAEHERALAQLEGERRRREALEVLVAEERVRFAAELARTGAGARAERGTLARRLHEAQRAVATLEAEVEAAGDAFRRRLSDRPAADRRGAAVEELVEGILGTVADLPGAAYEPPPSATGVPTADHPALTARAPSPAAAASPAVVGDLERAAARLRAAREAPAAEAEPIAAEAQPSAPEAAPPDAASPADEAEPVSPPEPPAAPRLAATAAPALSVIHASGPPAPTRTAWLRDALVALARRDEGAAERVLLALLPLQAARIAKALAYELVLPVTGRHHVAVTPGGAVTVTALAPAEQAPAGLRLEGTAAALAPLAAGGAGRRLDGVRARGGRLRLRRLLRALATPAGLPELLAADVRLVPADLLGVLAASVPARRVGDARARVAYLVADAASAPDRVVVVADAGGVHLADDDGAVDATVTVEPRQLIGVLCGTEPALVSGRQVAVATLHGWLRAAQGTSA